MAVVGRSNAGSAGTAPVVSMGLVTSESAATAQNGNAVPYQMGVAGRSSAENAEADPVVTKVGSASLSGRLASMQRLNAA